MKKSNRDKRKVLKERSQATRDARWLYRKTGTSSSEGWVALESMLKQFGWTWEDALAAAIPPGDHDAR